MSRLTINNQNITGKELIFKALRHEETPTMPWVPYAGVHAGKLKGYNATEVLQNADKLMESLLAVNEVYDPDGQPVLFDLQVEAEIYGCELGWADGIPPSVMSHPLSGEDFELPDKLPEKTDGRIPLILDVMSKMKEKVGDHTALYGLTCGPLTLASHLRGTELFMDMIRHPDKVYDLINFCNEVGKRLAEFYIEAGMDVIAVVDPLVSQVSPKHFNQFLAAPFTDVFNLIREKGVFSSFFVCGDATKNIEVMCKTNPDSIAVDENINMVEAKKITDQYNITLGGNIPLTTKMLLGNQQDNMKFVVDFLDTLDHHNLILAPGCDMPYDTPIENTIGVVQAVRDPEGTKKSLVNYEEAEIDTESVVIPDYANLEKALVEVFTLDWETCAACTYMFRAAEKAVAEFGDKVDLVEYRFTIRENVARVMKMGVKNLPSILINGELKYSSIIPSQQELVEEIKKVV